MPHPLLTLSLACVAAAAIYRLARLRRHHKRRIGKLVARVHDLIQRECDATADAKWWRTHALHLSSILRARSGYEERLPDAAGGDVWQLGQRATWRDEVTVGAGKVRN